MLRAVAVFALVWAAVASKPPSPAPAKAGQENQNQAAPRNSKPEPDNYASTDHSPKTAQPVSAVTAGDQTDTRKPPKEHPATDWNFIWNIANTGLLTFFSGALASDYHAKPGRPREGRER